MTQAPPYLTPLEHLIDWVEHTRLLLARHLARYASRVAERGGQLQDLWVALEEARSSLAPGGAPEASSEASSELIASIAAQLEGHQRWMAARVEATGESGGRLPVEDLRAIFELEEGELALLLSLVSLQLDVGLHRLATYAWADFAVKQPTLGFLAELVWSEEAPWGRALGLARADHALQRLRVLELSPSDRWGAQTPPMHARARVPERVVAFLSGASSPLRASPGAARPCWDALDLCCVVVDPSSETEVELEASVEASLPGAAREAHALARGVERRAVDGLAQRAPLLLLYGGERELHVAVARRCTFSGALVVADLPRALQGQPPTRELVEEVVALAMREATLELGALCLVLGELAEEHPEPVLLGLERALAGARHLTCLSVGLPGAALRALLGPCVEVALRAPGPERRLRLWEAALARRGVPLGDPEELEGLAHRYLLGAGRIARAVEEVVAQQGPQRGRSREREPVWTRALKASVHRQIQHGLTDLAEVTTTELGWEDLVVPEELGRQLREIIAQSQHGRQVYESWGFRRLEHSRGGLAVLFHGPPGTGKTLAAAIMARELAADLYRVDLSRIVSKWIGETEKNLARLFDEAERSHAVLLFDEADSLFSKRTAVSSSNDRHANLEVNYLLQRLERFDGVAILTSNFPESIDEAFQRRLRFRLAFPMPDAAERATIWRRLLPAAAPVAEGVAWEKLGREFELSPGHIKNAVLRAAFRAAASGGLIDYATLRDAARVEYRELGRVVLG
jgi:hypothetical protein